MKDKKDRSKGYKPKKSKWVKIRESRLTYLEACASFVDTAEAFSETLDVSLDDLAAIKDAWEKDGK